LTSALFGVAGCSGNGDRPPYASSKAVGGASSYQVSSGGNRCGAPTPDAGLCGNQSLPTVQERPNLYFIIDASGSMGDLFTGAQTTKYLAAVEAITGVLEQIGHRVSYGVALYPVNDNSDCGLPGSEVFPTQAGDSVTCSINGKRGDVLTRLHEYLSYSVVPGGGTPLSATLRALEPTLTSLSGKTAVILATDGAPNCNLDAKCGPELCEPNLNGATLFGTTIACDASFNCCDPKNVVNGGLNCVDSVASSAALAELHDHGISTYVIGLPGGDSTLGSVLEGLAISGGTARATPPSYYEADDPQTLANTLRAIATQIAVSCTITLDNTPPNWGQVNVYLDTQQVPQSTQDGWQQIDANTLEIIGTYCTQLQSGNVYQVQVTAGCVTYVN